MENCILTDKSFVPATGIESLARTCELDELFAQPHFEPWRQARIAKLVSILGERWFSYKSILELGCGFGHVGKALQKYGARVTFAEGRPEYIPYIREGNEDADIYLLDNDKEWHIGGRFDLVLHWGLLYHLSNWKRDLSNCLKHSSLISLETEVVDSDQDIEIEVHETNYDGALNNIGIRPSVANIEHYIGGLGCRMKRYDDSDLNAAYMVYDWPAGSFPGQWNLGHGRFWMIEA